MAADTSLLAGTAGRYATALFDLAGEGKELDRVEADLQALGQLITESADLKTVVESRALSNDQKARAMGAILEQGGACDTVKKFIGLISKKGRLNLLSAMIRDFHLLLSRSRGEVDGEVISAVALSDSQLEAVKASITKVVGAQVKLSTKVDESLLGGLIVRVGSQMFDDSLRTKLANVKLAMKEVG